MPRFSPVFLILSLIIVTVAPAALAQGQLRELGYFPVSSWADGVVILLCGQSYGTGWWVNDQYIVTAAHVVKTPACSVYRGGKVGDAELAAKDESLDVAVLKVSMTNPLASKHVFKIRIDGPAVGEDAYVIGYPAELLQLYGSVEEASKHPRVYYFKVPFFDKNLGLLEIGYTDVGNSGGPVVDSDGNVIGVVSFAIKAQGGVQYLFFATSSDKLAQFLEANGVDFGKAEGPPPSQEDVVIAKSLVAGAAGGLLMDVVVLAAAAVVAFLVASRGGGRR